MAGKKLTAGLSQDIGNNVIPTGNNFTTEAKTLAGTAYEEITVPTDAAEVQLSSDSEFTVGESSSADGYPTDDIKLGVVGMDSIWVKGSASQVINILWIKL